MDTKEKLNTKEKLTFTPTAAVGQRKVCNEMNINQYRNK